MIMAEPWCEWSQLPRTACGHCRRDRKVVTAVLPDFGALAEAAGEPRDTGPSIEAAYHGTCRGCGERWSPGDMITYSEDESGWVCASCGGG